MNPRENWQEEKRSAWLYRVLSDAESGSVRQVLFLELAQAAEQQANIWADALPAPLPAYSPDIRTRLVAWGVRRLGLRPLRSVLSAMKIRGMSLYLPPGHAMPETLENLGARHRTLGGGNLRAAVFGVNDGLVSNTSLILGMAGAMGATGQSGMVVLSGIAGLLAGAFSMAAGEYVSVRSQREMAERQIALEREEVELYPEEEAAELALIFQARGMAREAAQAFASQLIADPDRAMDALTREELGLNPSELGSPWGAALFSFFSFAAGAAIPLLPWLFWAAVPALALSLTLSASALFAVGALLSLYSGRNAWLGGLRMLAIGSAAGGATWLAGHLLGITLAS